MHDAIATTTTTANQVRSTFRALHNFVEEKVIDVAGPRRDNGPPVSRVALVAAACLASGCSFYVETSATSTDGDGGMTDAQQDDSGAMTGDAGLGCYGTGLVVVCPITQPPPSYVVSVATTFDTNVGGNCTVVQGSINNGPITGACVVVAEDIVIEASMRGVGPRPIVFVATKSLTVNATIDVASHRDSRGAGNSTTVCTNGTGPSGLGGGAGGAFGGGGGGGGGGGVATGGSTGPTSTPPTSLRGGCRGQSGGSPVGIGGDGGHGGGVFYAIAGTNIDITAGINASGEGGHGAVLSVVAGGGGGGGGGSGGMIGLDAPQVRVAGEVFANGGGGGGGSSAVENAGGGHESQSALAMPEGGTNAAGAGRGGRGAAGTTIAGEAGENRSVLTVGGGGGGGGAGYVQVWGTLTQSGQISPPPVL